MKPRDLKQQLLNARHQVVIFDLEGQIIESCDTIVSVETWPSANVFDQWPVLEGIRHILPELSNLEIPFRLPAVELSSFGLEGIFDFEFTIHPEHPEQIVWLMCDQSKIYRYFRRVQQERNMLLLEKEYRQNGRKITVRSALDA
ncbi:MAG: hypothetical protein AAFQ87_09615 [Bacteroidota bacterium]